MSHPQPVDDAPWIDESQTELDPQRPLRSGWDRARSALAVLVALAVVVGGAAFALSRLSDVLSGIGEDSADYNGSGSGSVVVQVRSGDTLTAVGERLTDKGVVASTAAFVSASSGETVEPGFYELRRKMSAESAVSFLLDGKHRVESQVAIPEGLTVEEILRSAAKQTDLSAKQLRAAASKPAALGLPRYAGGELEGYLFPATYVMPPGTDATELLTMMIDRFNQAASDVELEQAAADLDLTPHELVTVASLVQAEAQRSQDFGKVAQVVGNRTKKGMPLQFDSTVHYATDTVGQVYTTDAQRAVDSPYNTYLVTGLPPGPIESPGEEALAAAAAPTEGDWLYFVTVNLATGKTEFAEGLAEHNRNVSKLEKYCRTSDAC